MAKYRVTPKARDDLNNIGRYTEQNWGKNQRNTYLKNFENRFIWLSKNPQLGKHRSDIAKGYYSFPEGQHVIFYLIDKQYINIIGVPHKDMDVISYFLPD